MNLFPGPPSDPYQSNRREDFSNLDGNCDQMTGLIANEPLVTDKSKHVNPKTQQFIQKTILVLMALGLLIGLLVSIGIVVFLNRTGLTDVPVRNNSINRLKN